LAISRLTSRRPYSCGKIYHRAFTDDAGNAATELARLARRPPAANTLGRYLLASAIGTNSFAVKAVAAVSGGSIINIGGERSD
jgi:hypothetical protein